jgi:hypothetical protein
MARSITASVGRMGGKNLPEDATGSVGLCLTAINLPTGIVSFA